MKHFVDQIRLSDAATPINRNKLRLMRFVCAPNAATFIYSSYHGLSFHELAWDNYTIIFIFWGNLTGVAGEISPKTKIFPYFGEIFTRHAPPSQQFSRQCPANSAPLPSPDNAQTTPPTGPDTAPFLHRSYSFLSNDPAPHSAQLPHHAATSYILDP
ncbi:MAG: hypothetical protein IJI35_10855, partial [Kiritimatiellae bacterium]|nr:hypothetical protein [Kiritimatiellia bacterium]